MTRDDWFRRTTWSATDRAEFFARLERSRTSFHKAQYLRLQALALASTGLHAAAIELLDHLFVEYSEPSQLAQAHLQKAECLAQLNQPNDAVEEFRASLQAERDFPNVRTQSWLEFPLFIVRRELTDLYSEALAIVEEFLSESCLTFPLQRYQYSTVRALIAGAQGDSGTAGHFAKLALSAEAERYSGFGRHPAVGLVKIIDHEIHERLSALARE
jgi:tetratricopeptide (TPR) repeat protein